MYVIFRTSFPEIFVCNFNVIPKTKLWVCKLSWLECMYGGKKVRYAAPLLRTCCLTSLFFNRFPEFISGLFLPFLLGGLSVIAGAVWIAPTCHGLNPRYFCKIIVIHMGGVCNAKVVHIRLPTKKKRAYLCKNILIEMGGVLRYFSNISRSGVDVTLLV